MKQSGSKIPRLSWLSVVAVSLFLFSAGVRSDPDNVIVTCNAKTNWGEWRSWENCKGSKAINGFRAKCQSYQGFWKDDQGVTGMRFECIKDLITEENQKVTSGAATEGDWSEVKSCTGRNYAMGVQLRTDPDHGSFYDDAATSDCRLHCSDGTVLSPGNGHDWGEWQKVCSCPQGYGICGIRTQVETKWSVDKTAMNSMEINCTRINS